MTAIDVAVLVTGVTLLAGAGLLWRRAGQARLGTSAPMTIGALLVAGLGCIVRALVG